MWIKKFSLKTHLGILAFAIGVIAVTTFFYQQGAFSNFARAADEITTVSYTIASAIDVINQDGSQVANGNQIAAYGTGQSTTKSYLGMLFSGGLVPAGAEIVSAKVSFIPPQNQWITVSTEMFVEDTKNPATFTRSNSPSTRTLLPTSIKRNDNVSWTKDQSYSYDVTQLVNEFYKKNKSIDGKLSMIIQGKGPGSYGRKIIYADPSSGKSPTLLIQYRLMAQPTNPASVTNTPIPATPTRAVATPTTTQTQPATPTPTHAPDHSDETSAPGTLSHALGLWNPNPKYDTCTKAEHDSYRVQGPDGKWYPTWHPPVHTRANGTTCTFGHEHGRDPKNSLIWNQVRTHFAYDANNDGSISSSELATSGIPFGYVNEQLDSYSAAGFMRHEDHVGHKVEYANGEPDIATDQFDNNPTAGVVVPVKTASGNPKWNQSGARCHYFSKVHQGVSTADAFTNNLHELIYFSDCKGPTAAYDVKAGTAVMMKFGKVGEFTNLCDGAGDRTTPVVIGTTALNQNFPGTRDNGGRNIIQRNCLEKYFLVPQGQFSSNMYEVWPATIVIKNAAGKNIMAGANMLFDVEDANRYYNPSKPNNLGYTMDLCYEKLSGGRQARSGMCDSATDYGRIQGIQWDDPRSAFRGIHRGMYFMPPVTANAGGSEILYTDPFGGNAQSTPFKGSVKQYVAAKNVDHGKLGQLDPRVNDRIHSSGNNTVHAPN